MKAKNKAKELLDRYAPLAKYWDCYNDEPLEENNAKQCALIAVDEILKIELLIESVDDYYLRYWQEVKHEIEKIN